MAELSIVVAHSISPARPLPKKPLGSPIADSVSSLIVRGSLARTPEARAVAASSLALLGGSNPARIAFRAGLEKASAESVPFGAFASELARASRGPAADGFFAASMDFLLTSGGSREAAALASALARVLSEGSLKGAAERTLRLLSNPEKRVREGASSILISLCRHPLTDERELAELAYDTGTREGCLAAEAALRLPRKIIDIPENAA